MCSSLSTYSSTAATSSDLATLFMAVATACFSAFFRHLALLLFLQAVVFFSQRMVLLVGLKFGIASQFFALFSRRGATSLSFWCQMCLLCQLSSAAAETASVVELHVWLDLKFVLARMCVQNFEVT